MYEQSQIVATATVPHAAPGATDEARVVFRVEWWATNRPVVWLVYCSKGPYCDAPTFEVFDRKRDALAFLGRPRKQGFDWIANVPLRPGTALI